MLISSEKLIGLKVETEGGVYLGRVQSLDFDIDTQAARAYRIKPSLLEGGIFSEALIIHSKQIVSISEEKMIVLDNVVKYKEEATVFAGSVADT